MKVVAEFPTPEGLIVVGQSPPQPTFPWVSWVVNVPGLGQHRYSRKRDAMHHAKAAIRLLSPLPRFDLVKAWDKVREYA